MTESAAAGTPAPAWQRLHPATLLLAIVRLGPRSINLLPALAAIGIAGRWAYVLPALLLFLLLSLGAAWLAWWRFRYALGGDEIIIESGVFVRQSRTIPFDRIQDVSIEQGLIARALGIAKLGFETGAGGQKKAEEAQLNSIALADAGKLRETIRVHRTPAASVPSDTAQRATRDEGRLLFAMSPRQLLTAGLFNFSLAALAIVGTAAQFVDNFLPVPTLVIDTKNWAGFARQFGLDGWVGLHRWITGLAALLSLLAIGFAGGVATMFLTNWQFRLRREERALHRTRGLTTRTDVALPLRRIQAAIVVTGWLRQRYGWHELRLQSLARDGDKEKDHQVVPFGQLAVIDGVLGEIAMARPPVDTVWHPGHAVTALGGLIGATCAAIGGGIALVMGLWIGWLPVIAAPLITAAALFSARHHCWADQPGQVAIRRGFWKPRLTLLPHASVQSIDLVSNVLLRRLGLATLVFGVPGGSSLGSHAISAMPLSAATDLRTHMLAARTGAGV